MILLEIMRIIKKKLCLKMKQIPTINCGRVNSKKQCAEFQIF